MKKLLVIDGNAILHRAYHAYPPLTNPNGEVINVVFGFFSMILTVYAEYTPDYVVVCFDRGAPTFRMGMYAGYHADRAKMEDGFVAQIKIVYDILEKASVPMYGLDGYEADDLIGTIAKKTVDDHDEEVLIVTGDRDLLQLVNPHVKVLMPVMGFTKTLLFDEQAVEEKYGVHPRQFIDYKALIGDNSDGYPGVTGIGPKGAAKLLQEFETFENLYKNLDKVPEKTALKLATDAEQAALAKQLATIVTDAPINFALKPCDVKQFDLKALRKSFAEQGFKSLLARIDTIFGKEKEQLELL
ncbi:MAG: 5'-3' exonuclease [Candidatus Levyibacteriota bacterium]